MAMAMKDCVLSASVVVALTCGCISDGPHAPPRAPQASTTQASATPAVAATWPTWRWDARDEVLTGAPDEPFGLGGTVDHLLHRDPQGHVTALVSSGYTARDTDTKAERWRLTLKGGRELAQSMALSPDAVLFATLPIEGAAAHVRAASRETGDLLWEVRIPVEGLKPAPQRRAVKLAYSRDDNLVHVALRAPSQDVLVHIELDSGKVDGRWAPPTALTRLAWRWPHDKPDIAPEPRGVRTEHEGESRRYRIEPEARPKTGFGRGATLRAFDTQGDPLWEHALEVGREHRAEVRELGDRVIVLIEGGLPRHPEARLLALDRRDGTRLWQTQEVSWAFLTESSATNWVDYALDLHDGHPVVRAWSGIGKRTVIVHPQRGTTLVDQVERDS